jgi:hypothetical protein
MPGYELRLRCPCGFAKKDDLLNKENIRILCPRCRKYSLEFEITTLWD